jgi:hypothetical protein
MPLLTLSGHSRRCGRKSLIAIVDLEIRSFASAAGEGCSIRQSHGFVICRAGRASCQHSRSVVTMGVFIALTHQVT